MKSGGGGGILIMIRVFSLWVKAYPYMGGGGGIQGFPYGWFLPRVTPNGDIVAVFMGSKEKHIP